jgi:hypothetical protein
VSERAKAKVKAPEAKTERAASQRQQPGGVSLYASPYEYVFNLQRSIGNKGVAQLYRSALLQAKLRIGEPNDVYEQEADRVAERIMRMPDPTIQPKPT